MSRLLISAPASELLTLDEAKAQLRIDSSNTSEDALITAYIKAARERAEALTERAFITQTWELRLDVFPCTYSIPIELPYPPLQQVLSVKYLDMGGVLQTWDPASYLVVKPTGPKAMPAKIRPVYQQIYPVTLPVPDAIQIQFKCGYGDDFTAVPEMIRLGNRLGVAEFFENREQPDIDKAMFSALSPYMLPRAA